MMLQVKILLGLLVMGKCGLQGFEMGYDLLRFVLRVLQLTVYSFKESR